MKIQRYGKPIDVTLVRTGSFGLQIVKDSHGCKSFVHCEDFMDHVVRRGILGYECVHCHHWATELDARIYGV